MTPAIATSDAENKTRHTRGAVFFLTTSPRIVYALSAFYMTRTVARLQSADRTDHRIINDRQCFMHSAEVTTRVVDEMSTRRATACD